MPGSSLGRSRDRQAPTETGSKGKTESGVKYVERNALAGREFESFTALAKHLVE